MFESYCENTVTLWCDSFNIVYGLTAQRSFPNEAGQPFPRCHIEVDAQKIGMNRDELVDALAKGSPSIMVQPDGDSGLYLNPMTLEAGEEKIVQDRLLAIVTC